MTYISELLMAIEVLGRKGKYMESPNTKSHDYQTNYVTSLASWSSLVKKYNSDTCTAINSNPLIWWKNTPC